MKRLTALILVLIMLFSLAACGKGNNNDDPLTTPDVENTDTPQTSAKPTSAPKNTDKPVTSDDPKTTDKPTATDKPTTTGTPQQSAAPVTSPDPTLDPAEILENYDIGVTQEGEDIVVTVLTDTPLGEAVCKMAYVYSGEALQKVTATYILPTADLAKELSGALDGDPSIKANTVKVTGTNVYCELVDTEIEDFKAISRDDLYALLSLALSMAGGE